MNFVFLTSLVGIHAILSFAYYRPSSGFQLAAAIIVSVCMVYFFGRHNNWARRLVLITAALTFLVDLPKVFSLSLPGQAIVFLHLALAAFLLYWLNVRSGKRHFHVSVP